MLHMLCFLSVWTIIYSPSPRQGTKQVRDREGGQEITGQGRRPKDSFIHKEGILSESQSATARTSCAFAYSQWPAGSCKGQGRRPWEGSGANLEQQQCSSNCNRTQCQPGHQRCRARPSSQRASREQPSGLLAPDNGACSKATYHAISSGAAAQALPPAECRKQRTMRSLWAHWHKPAHCSIS